MNKILQNLFLIILVSLTLSGCGSDSNKKYEGFMMPESVAEGPDGSIYVQRLVNVILIKMARLVRLIVMEP